MGKEKVVCLVSGGIDSPVACALAAKKFEVIPLHFCLYPLVSKETFLAAVRVLRGLKKRVDFEKVLVYPWAGVIDVILRNRERRSYACLACRRGMFRVAESICEREGAVGIVTGESLGQKASQTLPNLGATASGIKFPILRPLLALDKEEIQKLSGKLGLRYETHAGHCLAAPRYPRTRAKPETIDELLENPEIGKAIRRGFRKILEVRTFDEDFQGYLQTLVRS